MTNMGLTKQINMGLHFDDSGSTNATCTNPSSNSLLGDVLPMSPALSGSLYFATDFLRRGLTVSCTSPRAFGVCAACRRRSVSSAALKATESRRVPMLVGSLRAAPEPAKPCVCS